MKKFKITTEGLVIEVTANYFTASQSGNVTFFDDNGLATHFYTYVTRVEVQ